MCVVTKSVFTRQYDQFRRLLIDARKAANLTQAEVAEELDRPQSFVAKYEGGERRLDVVEFLAVANAINVNPIDLIRQLQDI